MLLSQLSKMEFVAIVSTPISGKRKSISAYGHLMLTWDTAVAFVPGAHLLFPSVGAGIFSHELVFWWPYVVVWQYPPCKVESWTFRADWDHDCIFPETWVTLRTQIREMANSMPQVPSQGRMLMLHPASAAWGHLFFPWWGAAPRTQWQTEKQGFIPSWVCLGLFQTCSTLYL